MLGFMRTTSMPSSFKALMACFAFFWTRRETRTKNRWSAHAANKTKHMLECVVQFAKRETRVQIAMLARRRLSVQDDKTCYLHTVDTQPIMGPTRAFSWLSKKPSTTNSAPVKGTNIHFLDAAMRWTTAVGVFRGHMQAYGLLTPFEPDGSQHYRPKAQHSRHQPGTGG